MERRRDPSGAMLTLREFEHVYETQGYELWQEAGASPTVAKGQRRGSGGGNVELKWDAASVGAASKNGSGDVVLVLAASTGLVAPNAEGARGSMSSSRISCCARES